ncbi:RHS repeat-associated core domain-containing protein [Paludibaculum fermentans]|uniref:RHS repeat-associated core domain-containing protein n=1 Tax=Paludibaculum fermentans TaxID=1473598 RepID=A0A7S7SJN8_PALFE|nr:RHS repeat-associated core domain-containing protein [Paludibaculum fermentans]QOY86918.1 RHS repeat-associated core domain-containing protein [Paludibaculum fermentans]
MTTYAYDAMDNLTDVYQGVQHREFRYDQLGRLRTAKNPENGTTTYAYDKNGNLISKLSGNDYTCFGPVVTSPPACNASADFDSSGATNYYDALNRPTSKQYSDGTTPSVTYRYSEDLSGGPLNYQKGRLTSIVSGNTTIQFNSFDAAGRVLRHTQTTTGAVGSPYVFGYQYNTGGLLTQLTYPSGRVVSTTYDDAGRAGKVLGQLGSVSTAYAGPPTGKIYIQYAPHGAVSQMLLAGGTSETWQMNEQHGYNSRLQPTSISLATTAGTPVTIRNLTFGYGGAENNGNLLSQGIAGTGLASALSQSYQYDRLNRITKVGEGTTWNRNFDYDQYGNGWVSAYTPSSFAPDPSTPQSQGTINADTNQTGIAGSTWDGAGNLNNIGTGSFLFYYDAENRMIRSVLGSATVYQYDGQGRRVARIDCPSNMTTCDAATAGAAVTSFAYDAQGQLAAEYSNHPSSQPCTTCYLLADHLGSTRVMTDSIGTAVQCHDYLPFGEELLAGTSGRNGCYLPASGSGVLFTGKERDAETSLDYFGARYYSSAQGRFTSPDEFPGGIVDPFTDQQASQPGPLPYADITDPQTLNKYGYVRNNPLRYTDPDGHDWQDAVEFVAGVGRGVAASESFGAVGAPSESDSMSSRIGQAVGTGVVGVVGAIASVGGITGGVLTAPTGVGALAGGAVALKGAASAVGAAKNLGAILTAPMQRSSDSGSYTNTHESGAVYVGKGDRARSQASGRRVAKETGDKHVATDHTSASSSREGFKAESRRMDQARSEGKKLYNKRESPGKKMRQQDGEN